MQSGLYEALVRRGLLVPHEDLGSPLGQPHATLIRPERVPMVSYPYEWCFSQLRDAALAMLAIAREALTFGMVLKDASAYNIQFLRGRPILIDTLSFEPYAGGPWVAYRQFCQHFYAPLLLWSVTDPRLARLSQVFIDGVPLSLASKLMPRRSWLKPGALLHVHMHAAAEQKLSGGSGGSKGPALREESIPSRRPGPDHSRRPGNSDSSWPGPFGSSRPGPFGPGKIEALLESLASAVSATRWTPKSEWSSYYSDQPSYAPEAFARKLDLVTGWLNRLQPATVWDLGANTGQFSKVAARQGARAVALDSDPACVEMLYREARAEKLDTLLPLVADLTNPSPAIGWANVERQTLEQRGPVDLILALAVVHHLAIGNNVPLAAVADYFARLGRRAIVEFVPKSDPMVQRMLASRADVFESYTVEEFERAFSARFTIEQRAVISTSDRVLYLMTAL